MNKADLQLLERVFAREIDGHIYQGRPSKRLERLVAQGYLEPAVQQFPTDRFGPVICKGYALTHLGRLTYCSTC